MEQEVRQRKKGKQEEKQKLAFDPGKVFSPADAKESISDLEEELKKSLEEDSDSSQYRARKGQGGDRSGLYGGGDRPDTNSEIEMIRLFYSGENRRARRPRDYDVSSCL